MNNTLSPQADMYLLQTDRCTFYIEPADAPSTWLLSYRVDEGIHRGFYHYRRTSAPTDCAMLLAQPHESDGDWDRLKEKAPFLALPSGASTLGNWERFYDIL